MPSSAGNNKPKNVNKLTPSHFSRPLGGDGNNSTKLTPMLFFFSNTDNRLFFHWQFIRHVQLWSGNTLPLNGKLKNSIYSTYLVKNGSLLVRERFDAVSHDCRWNLVRNLFGMPHGALLRAVGLKLWAHIGAIGETWACWQMKQIKNQLN